MPWKTAGGGLGNLPPDTRDLVGRETELAWLEAEVGSGGDGRLVTLVGVGGVGKTRLAVRAADRARQAYPDGVWLADLAALHTTGLVPLAVLETLRLADRTSDGATVAVAAWARDKRLLLVLDSCEHVLPDCAALVAELTAAAPGVRVLATSRTRLGVPGERTLTVDPLPVGHADSARPAVADVLFARRAGAAQPGFVLDDTTRQQVAAICRGLDGIPLAIELAAARLPDLTLDALHTRLAGRRPARLDLLTSNADTDTDTDTDTGAGAGAGAGADGPGRCHGARHHASRHHALRTTIGWSHELCAPLERLLWARLSVFAGGFDPAAAEGVCAGGPLPADRIARLLDRLVAGSIVQRDRVDPARYRMLDTVREYGAAWLGELGEEDAVRSRHRDHYRRLARRGWAEWNTARQVAWSERVRTEHPNLRDAMACALDGTDRAVALEMAGHIGFLWRHSGHGRDARYCLERALAGNPPPGEARTRALWVLGAVALIQGDVEKAANLAVWCSDAARERGDPEARVAAMYLRGASLVLSGRCAEAVGVLAAVPRLPVRGDGFGALQLQARLSLSFAHLIRGEYGAARALACEVRAAGAERGEVWASGLGDYLVAQTDFAHGDVRAAERGARTALAKHRLVHNTVGVALALDTLAAAVVALGDGHRAARLLGIGSRIWGLTGDDQLNSPDLLAARRTHELRVRGEIGDAEYRVAYEEGRAMGYAGGLDYAARVTDRE